MTDSGIFVGFGKPYTPEGWEGWARELLECRAVASANERVRRSAKLHKCEELGETLIAEYIARRAL